MPSAPEFAFCERTPGTPWSQTDFIFEFWFLCDFVRRRRERMLICYPNYRSLKIFAITPAFVKRIIVELEVRAFNADRLMTRFYFDFRDASGILRDDAGEELPSATIARKEALRIVGQAVQDLTYRHSEGCVVIDVRDGEGPVLRVSAVFETTPLKE